MDIKKYTHEYESKAPLYEQLRRESLYVIEHALKRTNIKLHSTTSRVKTLDSFLRKIERKELDNPFEEIKDIVGLRVICLFLSDIERIRDVIRESFLVVAEDDKVEGAEVSSFGYMSVHFTVMMKKEYVGPRYDSVSNMPLEIQVRTIAMDAWANVSHYLEYKSDVDVPSDLRRDFYALSGLFYVADRHFELFFRSSSESKEKMVEAFAQVEPPFGEEINLDSLSAYLPNKFPDRQHSDSKSLSELITELSESGIKKIGELDQAVNRAAEAHEAYERDDPPFGEPGRKYTDVGTVRGSLDLLSEEYRKVRRKMGQAPAVGAIKKYQHLLR